MQLRGEEGGLMEPPKTGGGGGRSGKGLNGQDHCSVIMKSGARSAENVFEH